LKGRLAGDCLRLQYALQPTIASIRIAVLKVVLKSRQDLVAVVRENIEGESWLYLVGLCLAEVGLVQSVHRIASAAPHPLPRIDVEKAIAWVEGGLGINLAAGHGKTRAGCRN